MHLVELLARVQGHNSDFVPVADECEGSTALVTQPEVLQSFFSLAPRGRGPVRGGNLLGQEKLALLQKSERG